MRIYGDFTKSLGDSHLLVLRFVTNPALLFMAKLTSTPGFFTDSLGSWHPSGPPSGKTVRRLEDGRKEKSEYLLSFFCPLMLPLAVPLSSEILTPTRSANP